MAEAYSPWRLPVTLTPEEYASSGSSGVPACPLPDAGDAATLRAIEELPVSSQLPPTQQLWQPSGSGVPPGADATLAIGATGVAVAAEDTMRLQAWGTPAGTVVTFYGRFMRPGGEVIPFSHDITTLASNTVTSYLWTPGKGMLLNIAASVPSSTSSDGVITVKAELGRGQGTAFVPHTLLLYGTVTGSQPVSGGGLQQAPNAGGLPPGVGTFKQATAAGGTTFFADVTLTPVIGRSLRVTTVYAEFACTALAVDRTLFINMVVGITYVLQVPCNEVVRPNELGIFAGNMGGGFPDAISALPVGTVVNVYGFSLPESLWFATPVGVEALISQSVAGDRVSNLIVAYEER